MIFTAINWGLLNLVLVRQAPILNAIGGYSMRNSKFGLLLVFVVIASTLALYTTLIRPWHMRWGANDAEITMPLPGDRYIPRGTIVSTRAITIAAPPEIVWAWLVQLGQGRGGYYSYEWLENLFAADMHNAEEIIP